MWGRGNCVGLVLVTHSRSVGTHSPMLSISDAVKVMHSRCVGTQSPMLSIRELWLFIVRSF